jgi:hypothetical protein
VEVDTGAAADTVVADMAVAVVLTSAEVAEELILAVAAVHVMSAPRRRFPILLRGQACATIDP